MKQVKLLEITNCYQCHRRHVMTCVCEATGNKHPPPEQGIPDWCPLPGREVVFTTTETGRTRNLHSRIG